MRLPRSIIPVLLAAAVLSGIPTPAQAADGEQNQAAVDLAYEGKERFEAADYATALDRFQKAQALAGSPVFDLYIARSLKALGRWREALAAYEETEQYEVEASNVSFRQAQQNAATERRELEAKMPKLTVTAPHAEPGAKIELMIDGEHAPWPARLLAVDPGKHVLAATLGDETYDDVVTLAAGQNLDIELPLGRAEPSRAAGATTSPDDEPRSGRGLSPLAWTAFGIGAAGLVVGVTTGTWALVNMSTLNAYCADNDCTDGMPMEPDYRELKNTTGALATTADIGFIVAGVGAVLGVTFALTLDKGDQASAGVSKPSARVELRPAGTGFTLAGTF